MSTPLNRQKAASRARQAQALLGVLVIGGGAALAVGLRAGPRAEVPKGDKPEIPSFELPNKSPGIKPIALDTGGMADRLNLISNAPKAVEPPPSVAKTGAQEPVITGPAPADIRYLGAVMGSKSMALVSDSGKQRFVAVGDSFAGGTVESITDGQVKIGGDAPRTLELASRSNDVLTRGHAANRPGQPMGVAVNRPGGPQQGLTVVKPAPMMAAAPSGGIGINGEEIPPIPDYIRPDQAKRFDQIRDEQRARKAVGSEGELAEFAAKLLSTEDPKSVNPQMMEKAKGLEDVKKKGKS